ncbi:hypothetical protein [Endozoicomonas numazuensis]|uniref:Uncharacterized protein n=1 Tax=Endozoicomonas numazuensis TaxID=1137799 RepID=A0A081NJC9_9GAMM|nr:hypothetical protein [Endozoicomonas numazuensis]KEQ18552.1 hypothetical protein GZ78_13910 [Endozoicomonas numazuensis]
MQGAEGISTGIQTALYAPQRRTVKVLETADAILGAPLIAVKVAASPIFSTFAALQFSVTSVMDTAKNLRACKTIYQELRRYGTVWLAFSVILQSWTCQKQVILTALSVTSHSSLGILGP